MGKEITETQVAKDRYLVSVDLGFGNEVGRHIVLTRGILENQIKSNMARLIATMGTGVKADLIDLYERLQTAIIDLALLKGDTSLAKCVHGHEYELTCHKTDPKMIIFGGRPE